MPLAFARYDPVRHTPTPVGTVVVVEDPLVSKLVRAVLQRHGYEVRLAGPAEAAAALKDSQSQVGVLVTNAPQPFLEFAERIPLVYLTSGPDVLMEAAFLSCRVVLKPFLPEELVRAVGAVAGTL